MGRGLAGAGFGEWTALRLRYKRASAVVPVVVPAPMGPTFSPVPTSADPVARSTGRSRSYPRACGRSTRHDADFFLELLPGPRDRDGLPDSLRFWKRRIEETDPDQTFIVGLLTGRVVAESRRWSRPGCCLGWRRTSGPSTSRPHPSETEARLLKGLRKRCPN